MTSSTHTPEPTRIVLIKPSALGDIMHSLPVLSALRRRFPHAHIAWIVNRLYEPLLRNHTDLNEVIPFDRNQTRQGIVPGLMSFTRFLHSLRPKNFDLAIDLQGLLRTGLMTFATGAKRRIGLASAREGATWFYNEVIDDRSTPHAVDRYWQVAQAIGAEGDKVFNLPLEPAACQWVHNLLAGLPRPWLAVGVGSRWLTKRWPPGHFAHLAQKAQQAFGGTILFVGAPDERELAERAASLIASQSLNVTGQTTLPQLAALLAQADVMLANDTGPLHLAVALGRPVVAPYTCTKVVRTGPYGQEQNAVETKVWCQGSFLKNCDRLDCMAELTPDRLWPALHGILKTWQQKRRSA
jgi:heptosyltransferase-1